MGFALPAFLFVRFGLSGRSRNRLTPNGMIATTGTTAEERQPKSAECRYWIKSGYGAA